MPSSSVMQRSSGLALVGLAELHLELRAWPLAEREIERAAVLASEGDDPIGVAEAGRLRALLHLGLGHTTAGLREALTTRDEARRLGSALLEAECTTVAARAARAMGADEQAERLRAEAEAGLTRLGAAGLLDRLGKRVGRLIGAPGPAAGQCPCSSLCSSATRAVTSGGASTYP